MFPSIARAKTTRYGNVMGRGGARSITPVLYALAAVAIAAESIGAAIWVRRRFSRHEVQGESMEPLLWPGDCIVVDRKAYERRLPSRGDIVLAHDPREPSRELVKRVDHVDLHGSAWLLGDNAPQSTDSRTFGAVRGDEIIGRVRWRYWPPMRVVFPIA